MQVPAFTPLGRLARWAVALLAVTIAVDVLGISFDVSEISLLQKVVDGEYVSSDSLVSSDDRQTIASFLQLCCWLGTAIAFIRWFRVAYRNLMPLGVSVPRFKAGWAIGGWFVPILSLWRPKQLADDIWRGSDPDAPAVQRADWTTRPSGRLLDVWWAMWILGSVFGTIVARSAFSADTAVEIRNGDRFDVVVLAVEIAAAVLAMLVVRRTSSRQELRAGRLAAATAEAAPMEAAAT